MSNPDILTDDYVADLLSKDAEACALKYSAMGMEAFRSSDKKPTNMPKPNTRFLRHIIRDTDAHNKNLLAKEAAESKARLQGLEYAEEQRRLRTNPNSRDIRRRQMGDIHAILGGGSKPRRGHDKESSTGSLDDKRRHKNHGTSRDDWHSDEKRGSSRRDRDLFRDDHDRHDQRHGRLSRDDDGRRSQRDEERSSHRSRRNYSDSEDDDRRRRHRHSHSHSHSHRKRDKSTSPNNRHRSQSPERRREKSSRRDRSPRRPSRQTKKTMTTSRQAEVSDSDPLDDIIGPMPAPKPRGRGTLAGSSGIDRRFSESYDPKTDMDIDDDDDQGGADWDDAVEAFRDRQRLKQHQEERLRSAGFAEAQIGKIGGVQQQQKGRELTEEDVTWTKVGEKREWDRGKMEGGEDGSFI